MKSDIFKIHSVKWDGEDTAEEVVVEHIDTGKLTTLASKNLFRSWALEMVKEVDIICENNGRDNACYDMRKKIEEASSEKCTCL